MSNLQLAIAGVAILLLVYRFYIRPLSSPVRHLPAPDQGPAHEQFFVEPNPDQLTEWARHIPNKGFIRYYGILNIQKVLVTDPAAVHDILTVHPYSYIKPPRISKIIRNLLGDGIIVVEGDAHKTQKKVVQPAFKIRQIKDLYPVFAMKTQELVDILAGANQARINEPDSAAVDLGTYLHQATLDVIGIAGFGLDFNCLKDPKNKLATDYARWFTPSKEAQKYRMLALIMPAWLLDRLPLKRNQERVAAVAAVRECAGELIEQRGAALDSLEKKPLSNAHKDIIGVLMDDGGVRDKETLINQSMTILGAGHDTVHFAIESAIWEMIQNPEMQDRLRKEIRQELRSPTKESGRNTSDFDIDSLPYLQAVCNETLRLHHSVPMMHRHSVEDVVVAGQPFPKGTPFVMPIRAFNHSPKLWKSDPTKFNPERWLEDSSLGGAEDRRANLTFSAGARVCVGERFARAELKHLLAGLIGRYKFTWAGTGEDGKAQERQLEHGITSKMIGGLWVKMQEV